MELKEIKELLFEIKGRISKLEVYLWHWKQEIGQGTARSKDSGLEILEQCGGSEEDSGGIEANRDRY